MKIRVKSHSHTHVVKGRRVTYHQGETFEGPASLVKNLPDRLEAAGDTQVNETEAPSNLGDMSRNDLFKMAREAGYEVSNNISKADLVKVLEEQGSGEDD